MLCIDDALPLGCQPHNPIIIPEGCKQHVYVGVVRDGEPGFTMIHLMFRFKSNP